MTFAAALVIAGLRTPDGGVAGRLLRDAAAKAAGTDPILADPLDAEALALDGRRILIGNPLDAFPRREQRLYLDWASGRASGDVLLARARAVLVSSSERAQERLTLHARFREAGRDAHAVLYVRRSRGRRPPE
ncbi:MAG: hypothetical protein C4345_06100 [Chloroflexota bacterium]